MRASDSAQESRAARNTDTRLQDVWNEQSGSIEFKFVKDVCYKCE